MKKLKISLLLICLCSLIGGGYFLLKNEQDYLYDIYFADKRFNVLKFDNMKFHPIHSSFYKTLGIEKTSDDIINYNICFFKDEIINKNKKTFSFNQKKLEDTLTKHCEKTKVRMDNEIYYSNLLNLCNQNKECKKIEIIFNNVALFKNKEAYKIDKLSLTKIDFNSFVKDTLKIQDPDKMLLYYINQNGIGNQLFQYWGAQVYAQKKGLNPLPITSAPIQDIFGFEKPNEIFKNMKSISTHFEYFNHWIDFDKDTYIIHQNPISVQNLRGFEEYIQKNTKFSTPLTGKSKEIAEKMKNEISVSLHIRRGDFKTHDNSPMLDKKYYELSVFLMKYKYKNPHFYIFSDEIEWAKENLKIDGEHTFVDWSKSDVEDLQLMTYCKNHIIANSSFSWWGAFLSPYKDKLVFLPPEGFYTNGVQNMAVDDNWMVVEEKKAP